MEKLSEFHTASDVGKFGISGNRLKHAREFLGFNAEEVSLNLKMDISTLHEIEEGSISVSYEILKKLSNLYDRPVKWFLKNLETGSLSNAEATTPLPWMCEEDQCEYREFRQILETKDKKSNGNDKVEKLRTYRKRNYRVEELHDELRTYESSVETGRVNVLDAISRFGVTVILRPLRDISGTLLKFNDNFGLLLSVLRSKDELRFATATALSWLLNRPELEEGSNLKTWYQLVTERELRKRDRKIFSTALNLLLPNFLLFELQQRQKWTDKDMANPVNIYQASLRLGASYHATVHAFERLGCFTASVSRKLLKVHLSGVKRTLLEDYQIKNLENIDVWCISEKEEGTAILSNPRDLFVLQLQQNGSAGYHWDIDVLKDSGFAILKDSTKIVDFVKVGTPSLRNVICRPPDVSSEEFILEETCPWPRKVRLSNRMTIKYQRSTKPKEGLYRKNESSF